MATFKWSSLVDGSKITFNFNADVLDIDVNATAASAILARDKDGLAQLTILGKTVTLAGTIPENLTTTNVFFSQTGSQLMVGDNTTGVAGDPLPNNLTGTTQDDQIHGLGGADMLNGLAGHDLIYGNAGADNIVGSAGNDTVYAGPDADTVNYKGQADANILVRGGLGGDLIYGSLGNDRLNGDGDKDTIYGGLGKDVIEGGTEDDLIYGNQEDDLITVSGTSPVGQDTVFGGQGNDNINYANVLNSMNDAQLIYGNLGNDSIQGGLGADTVFGGQQDDTIKGGGGKDSLLGNLGNDSIEGNFGNDILVGGAGDDSLFGGKESDILEGGTGVDLLQGGRENTPQAGVNADVFVFSPGDSGATAATADTIADFHTIEDDLDLIFSGTAGNYLEQKVAGGYAEAFAQAQILMNQNAAVQYVFIAGDTNGYLFAHYGQSPVIDFSIILNNKSLVTDFGFSDII